LGDAKRPLITNLGFKTLLESIRTDAEALPNVLQLFTLESYQLKMAQSLQNEHHGIINDKRT
jgi:hypothetical protein